MKRTSFLFVTAVWFLLGVIPDAADARVVRFVVEQRVVLADGRSWGTAGPYERLDGVAHMEVDPRDPLNAVIVNLDKAPRNARGMVEFSAPFRIVKPVDMSRGNRKIWYGVNNRGNPIEFQWRAFPAVTGNPPLTVADIGENHILLREGYAFVDAGWHGDGIPSGGSLYPKFPVATQPDGSPMVGPLRLEYTPSEATFTLPLAAGWRPYEPADTTTRSTLTVRDRSDAPRQPIASDRWAFGTCTAPDKVVPTTTDLCLFDGFKPGRIYELTYRAKNPVVMGLAYAVTRDVGSFLRYELRDDAGNPNPLAIGATSVGIRRAYASGTSSTGMYQREFLYLGFNEDEAHRKVFDGVTIFTGGTHRLFANVQFAHPTFYSGQEQHHDYTSTSYPPFTFAVTTDPVSGIRDGILKRPATDPLVIQVDNALEIWQWKGSLNVVDGAGNRVPLPDNVRLYFQASAGHTRRIAGLLSQPQPPGPCRYTRQGMVGSPLLRALVPVMDAWADRGVPPPPSNYPRLGDRTLVSMEEYRAAFPAIPGVEVPRVMNELHLLNFGPGFNPTGGVQTQLPPAPGGGYKLFVPRADEDGIDVGGIRSVDVRVPLGTNVGWNMQVAPPGLCGLDGSFFPFAKTKAERSASGDPRPSLEERYKDHAGFVAAVEKAANDLVAERFLLAEDARRYIEAASKSDVLR